MAARAFSWLSGVTPAQQETRTEIGISHNRAFRQRALEITQMSVHRPTNSTAVYPPASTKSQRATDPNSRFVDDRHGLSLPRVPHFWHDLPTCGYPARNGPPEAAAPPGSANNSRYACLGYKPHPLGIPGYGEPLRAECFAPPSSPMGRRQRSLCISTTTNKDFIPVPLLSFLFGL